MPRSTALSVSCLGPLRRSGKGSALGPAPTQHELDVLTGNGVTTLGELADTMQNRWRKTAAAAKKSGIPDCSAGFSSAEIRPFRNAAQSLIGEGPSQPPARRDDATDPDTPLTVDCFGEDGPALPAALLVEVFQFQGIATLRDLAVTNPNRWRVRGAPGGDCLIGLTYHTVQPYRDAARSLTDYASWPGGKTFDSPHPLRATGASDQEIPALQEMHVNSLLDLVVASPPALGGTISRDRYR